MTCLLCAEGRRQSFTDLVAVQEHAMHEHGYTPDDHRRARRSEVAPNRYRWTFPDGRTWLEAVKELSAGGEDLQRFLEQHGRTFEDG
jgi:hypothetical protein